jgi:hypothetical protein
MLRVKNIGDGDILIFISQTVTLFCFLLPQPGSVMPLPGAATVRSGAVTSASDSGIERNRTQRRMGSGEDLARRAGVSR